MSNYIEFVNIFAIRYSEGGTRDEVKAPVSVTTKRELHRWIRKKRARLWPGKWNSLPWPVCLPPASFRFGLATDTLTLG